MTATLKLLGGMSLEDQSGAVTGQVAQRRRLALLAVLGTSRSSVSRDRLVALLWPELDTEGARHRLSDSVYVIRRALGEAAVVTAGDDVKLDERHLDIDVREFERTLDAGEPEAAIALYGGPFLDGFHLNDAPEFERWVDDERSRLRGRLAHALGTLASTAERRHDFAAAADRLRRLATLDPLDAHVALRLMRALEQAGHGAAALRHARVYQAMRHAELELGEDPEIRAAADALAARLEAATETPELNDLSTDVAAEAVRHSALPERLTSVEARSPRRRLSTRYLVSAGLVIATLAVVTYWTTSARSGTARPADDARWAGVAVFPFLIRGEGRGEMPGEAMAVLLATKLDGGAGWRSIDPNALFAQYRPGPDHPDPRDAARLARRLGADYFVLGDVVHLADKINLGAALYDARTGDPVLTRVAAQGASPAVFDLVDSLATRLLVGRRDEPVPQFARLASLTTSSLPALKDYLEGEGYLRAGRYTNAAESLRHAIAADSTFALAYYRLAWAYSWSREADQGEPLRMAARYGARLPERIRLTVDGMLAAVRGDVSDAERLLRTVVVRHPDDFDANYQLGDLLFHLSPNRGVSARSSREPLARAVMLDPSRSAEPLFHLISIAAGEGRYGDVDSLGMRFLSLHPEGELSATVRPILALVRKDTIAIEQAARELGRRPTQAALRVAALAIAVSGDVAIGGRLLMPLNDPTRAPAERAAVVIALARLAGGRGEWATADSLFVRARMLDSPSAIDARARLLSLPIGDPPTASVRSARADMLSAAGASAARPRLLAGLLTVRLGDASGAQATVNELATIPPNDRPNRALWTELAARSFLAQGRAVEALAVIENMRPPQGPALRFLRGEVLEALGRNDEALRWYEVAREDYTGELYVAAIARARSRLASSRRLSTRR